jgi:hypothetical protein
MHSMRARQFVAIMPLHTEPGGPFITPGEREEVLSDALRGVVLGGYDELVCAWIVQNFNLPTLRVIVSLIERVREAGNQEAVDAELALRHPQPAHRHADRGIAQVPQYGHHPRHGVGGSSGPR